MDDPVHMYLAHQQGAGGFRQIFNAVHKGTSVNNDIRRNIRSNGISLVTL